MISEKKESFYNLAKQLNVSKRNSDIQWNTLKNFSVKEGSKIAIFGHAELIAAWLVKYGLASSVDIFLEDNYTQSELKKLESHVNQFRQGKEKYLPRINFHNKFSVSNSKDISLIEKSDLIIFYNKDINFLHYFFEFNVKNVFGNVYIKLYRHINVHTLDQDKIIRNVSLNHIFSDEYLSKLSNHIRHSLFLHKLGYFISQKTFDRNVTYKKSYPVKFDYQDIYIH